METPTKVRNILTWNSMGIAVKIWDKCCIVNGKFHSSQLRLMKFFPFPTQHLWYLSQISLLPMLLHTHINYSIEIQQCRIFFNM